MAEEKDDQHLRDLDLDEVKKEAEVFLNDFNDNIPHSIAGIGSFIREDQTSDTWFYGDSKEDLYLIYALLVKQLGDHMEENMFEVILHIQTKLAQVYEEEYTEYLEKIQKFGDQFEKD